MVAATDQPVPSKEPEFSFEALKAQVEAHLGGVGLPRKGSWPMLLKVGVLLVAWGLVYAGLLTFGPRSLVVAVGGTVLLAGTTLTIQLAVMHDASHRGLSGRAWLNRLASWTLTCVGASSIVWYHKHVRSHHGHTNEPGRDPDLDAEPLFRFCPQQPWRPWHRWQHLYAIPLYSLLALRWVWLDDLLDALRNTYGLRGRAYAWLLVEVAVCRVLHLGAFLVLPYLVVGRVGPVVGLYLLHWLLMGLAMPIVFQPAHVTGVQAFPAESDRPKDWALRQVTTTTDFGVRHRLLTWFLGGLNFQVEHHIFPTTCHQHYPAIQPIVKRYCRDHGVVYHEYPSFLAALRAHFTHLRNLGRRPA